MEYAYGNLNDQDMMLLYEMEQLLQSGRQHKYMRCGFKSVLCRNVSRCIWKMLGCRNKKMFENIYYFCHTFIKATEQPESLCIVTLVYVIRMLKCTFDTLSMKNWKKLLFYSFTFALKYLEEDIITIEYIMQLWTHIISDVPFDHSDFIDWEFYLISNKDFRIHIPYDFYNRLEIIILQ